MPTREQTAELAQELGRRIRRSRAALTPSITQEGLAHQAGMHRAYIGHVERGEVNISVYNMVRIAEALGIDPAEWCGASRPDRTARECNSLILPRRHFEL